MIGGIRNDVIGYDRIHGFCVRPKNLEGQRILEMGSALVLQYAIHFSRNVIVKS